MDGPTDRLFELREQSATCLVAGRVTTAQLQLHGACPLRSEGSLSGQEGRTIRQRDLDEDAASDEGGGRRDRRRPSFGDEHEPQLHRRLALHVVEAVRAWKGVKSS